MDSGRRTRSFLSLIQPYEGRVYSAAFAILRNDADAEDAAQEPMLKALKHIRQFCAQTRFSTWLIQITVNEARMRRRRDHADIMEPMLDQMDEEGNYTPRDLADWREIPLETLERKENPSAACRRPGIAWAEVLRGFVLRDMQHLSIEETAITLGNSAASVKICLPHARLMLRDCQPQDCRQLEQQGVFCKGTKPW